MEKVSGYKDLTQSQIHAINTFKGIEAEILNKLFGETQTAILDKTYQVNNRWFGIGITHIEQGFMALVRSIAEGDDK
jgi:hypothetical protein